MLSNLEANLELIHLVKSIAHFNEFIKQFNILVSSSKLTCVFKLSFDTIVNFVHDVNIYAKCMIISDIYNECYIYLCTHFINNSNITTNPFGYVLNKNIKQDVLHKLLVMFMYCNVCIYPTEFIDVIDLDKLYLMFINRSFNSISHKYEHIHLHFKNNKVDIDKYNDIIIDNIIRVSVNFKIVNLDIFNFTPEQLNKLKLYSHFNTIDNLHHTMMNNNFDYDVVKHIFDTNPDYTPNISIYNDVMRYCSRKNISIIFELLKSHGCIPQYINIVKYVIQCDIDISLELLDTYHSNDDLKLLINIVDVKPEDKMIYIPKYCENVVLPVERYFDDDSYVKMNIFLASIINNVNETMKIKDIKNIMKQKNNRHVYINLKSRLKYIHINDVPDEKNIHIHIDNFIDYVLDKYLP